MFSSVGQEFHSLAAVILIGIAIGMLFDFYRVLRSFWKISRVGILLMDLAFWLISSIMVIAALVYSNYGELRLYVFAGLAAGLGSYYYLLSRFFIRFWYYLDYGIITAVSWIIRVILTIVRAVIRIVKWVIRPVVAIVVLFIGFLRKLRNKLSQKSAMMKNKLSQNITKKIYRPTRKSWKEFLTRHRNRKKK